MPKIELFVSIDIETDGPIPYCNSMLSLGAAAFCRQNTEDKFTVETFYVTLKEFPAASPDPLTMSWWKQQPKEAWENCRLNAIEPAEAMKQFSDWWNLISTQYNASLVPWAKPKGFDWMFVYWYCRFYNITNIPFSCGDIRSYAMGRENSTSYRNASKARWKELTRGFVHTHHALDDAIEQGAALHRMIYGEI